MLICVKCKKEMKVKEIGIGARWGDAHVYAGDMWECPICHTQTLNCPGHPVHDPKKKIKTIQMD